jgi:single-strand selective monofunctional uracil DNA glycosylase
MSTSDEMIAAARRLSAGVGKLKFAPPVTHVYNPLVYAWTGHEMYLRRFGDGSKRVLFLGMNPGPFGMAQTGIPFGQIAAVRDWLGIRAAVTRPRSEHPRRPVLGFDCHRNEVSGERLWSLFARRFGTAQRFFEQHLVINYCPLAFLEESGRNRTPDKLPPRERKALYGLCDDHLRAVVRLAKPDWIIGVGAFATERARESLGESSSVRLGQILHPSPASPAANKDWAGTVTAQLQKQGVW